MAEIRVDGVDALQVGCTRTFDFESGGHKRQAFLMRLADGQLKAYLNQCTHWPVALDYGDGDFLYRDRIVCKMHGAIYNPIDGACEAGPCCGEGLVTYPVHEANGHAYVQIAD